MTSPQVLRAGDLVEHLQFGLGKVVSRDGDYCRVYFKDRVARPEDRTAEFALPSDKLKPVHSRPDAELDNLPPWQDGRFARFPTGETLETTKQRFRKSFSNGFDDPKYLSLERSYKVAAHDRYGRLFASNVRRWIASRDDASLTQALDAVYGDRQAAKDGPEARLNLLYQKVEEPAYFEALGRVPERTLSYAEHALDFIDDPSSANFEALLASLESLPGRPGGATPVHWTTLTWLPFIARPDIHIFIKPTITRTFASLMAFELRYRPDLNFQTYTQAMMLGQRMRDVLQNSDLNLGRRPLDMIDVQSFMWVVLRYTESSATP